MYVCMYVCIYVCTVYIYVCMYTLYVCMVVCTYACNYVCMCVFVWLYVCRFVCLSRPKIRNLSPACRVRCFFWYWNILLNRELQMRTASCIFVLAFVCMHIFRYCLHCMYVLMCRWLCMFFLRCGQHHAFSRNLIWSSSLSVGPKLVGSVSCWRRPSLAMLLLLYCSSLL